MSTNTAIEYQLEVVRERYDAAREPALRALLAREPWALWATLYVDSGRPAGSWTWGARGRVGEAVAALLGGPLYFTAAGDSPEATCPGDSGVAEMWGVAHALRAALVAWPWLAGVGVRCDNLETTEALSRRGRDRLRLRRPLRDALASLSVLLRGLAVRGQHVRGHGRAETGAQRAWNHQADRLAGTRR